MCYKYLLKKCLVLSPFPLADFSPEIRVGLSNYFIFSVLAYFPAGNFTLPCASALGLWLIISGVHAREAFFLGFFPACTRSLWRKVVPSSVFKKMGLKSLISTIFKVTSLCFPHYHLYPCTLFPSNTWTCYFCLPPTLHANSVMTLYVLLLCESVHPHKNLLWGCGNIPQNWRSVEYHRENAWHHVYVYLAVSNSLWPHGLYSLGGSFVHRIF